MDYYDDTSFENDCGCLEIQSPVFQKLNGVKDFYNLIDNIAKKHGMVPQHPDVYGGGCHIHIGVSNDIARDLEQSFLWFINLFRFIENNHYLNWMFNEYCDTISAQPLCLEYGKKEEICKILACKDSFKEIYKASGSYCDDFEDFGCKFDLHKGSIIRYSQINGERTIEFRFFDMPAEWQVLEDHTLLVDAILKHVMKITKANILVKPCDWKLIKTDRCIGMFQDLIKLLGLDWNTYKWYVDNNYYWRKKYHYFTPN